ncbi:hypothetical protein ACFSQT_11815 [Mesorhizobium calcicola]|uniref:Uncharacterized protein n=1 Tax=Mesorhizobium calcicola TaxID=1300310 RepID=A0ABW4WE47_9HYPH
MASVALFNDPLKRQREQAEKPENRLFRRLLTALHWFRQSFSARANEDEAIVALAVAFETLLTDHYGLGAADGFVAGSASA